jgi:Putative ATPase subunit of terminase (gpP-like)
MPAPSIKSVGIKRWLNSDSQREMHNGHGFERLFHLIAKPPDGLGWSPAGIAKEFDVIEKTIYLWKGRLIEEGYLTKEGYANPTPNTNQKAIT